MIGLQLALTALGVEVFLLLALLLALTVRDNVRRNRSLRAAVRPRRDAS